MTPHQMFTGVLMRLARGWSELSTFRDVAQAGIPAAEDYVDDRKERFVNYLIKISEWPKLLNDEGAFKQMGGPEALINAMTRMSLEYATVAIDAASLVFAHSIIDGAAIA